MSIQITKFIYIELLFIFTLKMSNYLNLKCIQNSESLKESSFDVSLVPGRFRRIRLNDDEKHPIVLIENDEDFVNAMECFQYHGAKELPHEIYEYAFINANKKHLIDNFKDFHYDELSVIFNNTKETILNIDPTNLVDVIKYKFNIGQVVYNACDHFGLFKFISKTLRIKAINRWNMGNILATNNLDFVKYVSDGDNDEDYIYVDYIPDCDCSRCYDPYDPIGYCDCAASKNNFPMLKYFIEESGEFVKPSRSALQLAVKNGNIEMAEYMRSVKNYKPLEYGDDICDYAVYSDIKCLEYFMNKGFKIGIKTATNACSINRLDMLMFLHKNNCEMDHTCAEVAAFRGSFECLEFLINNGINMTPEMCVRATHGNHVNCLKFLVERGCEINMGECRKNTMYGGCIDAIKYLHTLDSSWDIPKDKWDVHKGLLEENINFHYDYAKFAMENGCEIGPTLLFDVARTGACADAFKYLYEYHIFNDDLDMDITDFHMKLLKKLSNCMWLFDSQYDTKNSTSSGLISIFEFVFDWIDRLNEYFWITEGIECKIDLLSHKDIDKVICYRNRLEIVLFLREKGFGFSEDAMSEAIKHGNCELVKYLMKNGYALEPTNETFSNAATSKHNELIKLLHENTCNLPKDQRCKQMPCAHTAWDKNTVLTAAEYCNDECVRYAIENGCEFDESVHKILKKKMFDSYGFKCRTEKVKNSK